MSDEAIAPAGSPAGKPNEDAAAPDQDTPQEETVNLFENTQPGIAATGEDKEPSEGKAVDGDVEGGNDDAKDDSEAETVLSSPVKRREDLKKSKGLSSGLGKATSATEPEQSTGRADASDDESDLSDTSLDSDSSQELEKDDADLRSINSNPRKRKHRASSFSGQAATLDSAKRQRRASDTKGSRNNNKALDDTSPGPRSRRNERAVSIAHSRAADGDAHTSSGRAGRLRRSGASGHESKTPQEQWDSDSSSDEEDLKLPPQSRSGRNLNRSTSTPGRPLGRDHKRHVNKYGFTRLAEACEDGDLDLVKEWREKDPEQLELPEFAGNTPLQVASLNGHAEVVDYLLKEGCNAHCANTDKDTPLLDAVENGHIAVVELLLKAGVDPLRQNRKGQQALDVITEQTEDGPAIRALLKKAIEDRKESGKSEQERDEKDHSTRPGPRQGLHFMARTPENLLTLVSSMDREGVKQFLDAHVPVDNKIVAAAAGTGDAYLVNMLLAEMSSKQRKYRPERLMLKVLGSSHIDMVKFLTELEYFNPTYRSKDGMAWHELAEKKGGPFWREEKALLLKLFEEANANSRLSSSPVSKREGVHRRQKSPLPSRGTEDVFDEETSPDLGRVKRRLVSRKDMRPSSARESQSPAAASSPDPVPKHTEGDAAQARQVGRPRTKSISAPSAGAALEIKTKRVKSGANEKLALFESAGPSKKKRADDQNQRRPASEIIVKRKGSAATNGDTTMEDAPGGRTEDSVALANGQAMADAAALKRSQEIEAEKQRLATRLQKIRGYPRALFIVLAGTFRNDEVNAEFVKHWFLPIRALSFVPPQDARPESERREGMWVASYHAAALLQGAAADVLLDLPHNADAELVGRIASLRRRDMSREERIQLRTAITQPRLAAMRFGMLSTKHSTDEQLSAAGQEEVLMVNTAKKAFDALEPMFWINAADYLALEAWLRVERKEQYGHLAKLPEPAKRELHKLLHPSVEPPPPVGLPLVWHRGRSFVKK